MATENVKVFLNHASEDKPLVRKLYRELKRESWIMPWLDEEEILPGQDWAYEIDRALEEADAVIICLSKTSIGKIGVVQAEIHKAQELQKRRPEGYVFMIPVLLEKCEIPSRLNSLHWVDVSVPENVAKIIRSLEGLRKTGEGPSARTEQVRQGEPDPGADARVRPPSHEPRKKKTSAGGAGLTIGGNVQITNGDIVAGDKNINVDKGGFFAGGDVQDSTIIVGNQNRVGIGQAMPENIFDELFKKIDQRPNTSLEEKDDLKANLAEIRSEVAKGDKAEEPFLSRRLRAINKIAPDIAETLLANLASPAAGLATVVRNIAERARRSTDAWQ